MRRHFVAYSVFSIGEFLFAGTTSFCLVLTTLKITYFGQSIKAINQSTGSKAVLSSYPFFRSFSNLKMSSTLTSSPSETSLNSKFDSLRFDNRNLRNLPVDTGPGSTSRPTPNVIFSTVKLQPVKNPKLICVSPEALQLLGLPMKEQNTLTEEEVTKIERLLSGNELIPGSQLAAHCYCGMFFIIYNVYIMYVYVFVLFTYLFNSNFSSLQVISLEILRDN